MKQNCQFWLPSIYAKIQNFEGFFKNCFSYWRLPLVKIYARLNSIWGSKGLGLKTPKRSHFMYAESMQKTFKILTLQPLILY